MSVEYGMRKFQLHLIKIANLLSDDWEESFCFMDRAGEKWEKELRKTKQFTSLFLGMWINEKRPIANDEIEVHKKIDSRYLSFLNFYSRSATRSDQFNPDRWWQHSERCIPLFNSYSAKNMYSFSQQIDKCRIVLGFHWTHQPLSSDASKQ